MKFLVDTHVFLFILISPQKISKNARNILLDSKQEKLVSTVTFWEISLKYQLGKLHLKGVLPDQMPAIAKEAGFEVLNLTAETASSFYQLPKINNGDPFDRMLAWQTISNNCSLLTKDRDFTGYKDYGLKTVW